MQRYPKTCCNFAQNQIHKANIPLSNFDGQLQKDLFTCLCFCIRILKVVDVVARRVQEECITSKFGWTLTSMLEGDYF